MAFFVIFGGGEELTTDDRMANRKLKKAFDSIKAEFNEHLDSINENTNEIRQNYDYICELDAKMEKLAEKIDELSLFLNDLRSQKDLIVSLSPHEQKVFLVLYLEHSPLPFLDLVKRVQLPSSMVHRILDSLIEKEIPIIVQEMEDTRLFMLDSNFKEKQARENVVKIDESVTRSLFVKNLNSFF